MTLRLGIFPNVCLLDALRWSLLGVFLTPLTALLRPPRDVYYTERQGWSFKWGEQSYSVLALCSFFLILVTLTMKAAATLLPPAPQTLPYVFREASGRYIQPLNRTDVISRGLVHTICKCGSSYFGQIRGHYFSDCYFGLGVSSCNNLCSCDGISFFDYFGFLQSWVKKWNKSVK